jgi:glycosyltransferase involved in cell wall biosynthesis
MRPDAAWRARAAEAVRRCAIQQVGADVVHVGSVFEGLVDDCATLIDPGRDGVPTAATIYDFIPYLNAQRYLAGAAMREWYMRKLESVRNASLLLGISESACAEARTVLGERCPRVVNVSSAANPRVFFPAEPGDAARRLGLHRPFVMYTGGIDWRKNIEGLIAAFAALPRDLREQHQLAVVCHAEEHARTHLADEARKAGLGAGDIVLTGYVPDADLADLYRSCKLFVFPSLHEGFGLPALEAMMCGAAVIGSDASSIPEVIGRADALFDPRSVPAMTSLIARALADEPFRQSLKAHAMERAAHFSWEHSARAALDAMEELHASWPRPPARALSRPLLALHAPLPPARSGIADYTCELLPHLERHYEIELVHQQEEVILPAHLAHLPTRDCGWFLDHAGRYDRVVYQFGNSMMHAHMFGALRQVRGAVVLHDFYLGGVLNWMETLGHRPDAFRNALVRSHGTAAVAFDREHGREAAVYRYPANRFVVECATGVIVHSRFSVDQARSWYGPDAPDGWHVVPHLRRVPAVVDRAGARAQLGIAGDEFLVCSFGHLAPTKLIPRLLAAWRQSSLARDPRCRLVLVGENTRPPDGDEIAKLASAAGVRITGYADRELYERYLAAADLAVQLRTNSRGETSGAVLDCLAWGVPVVANANGSTAEYPPEVVSFVPDAFSDQQLVAAIEQLHRDPAARQRRAEAGRAHVVAHHDPARVAAEYRDAIEAFAARPQHVPYWNAVAAIGALGAASDDDLARAAIALEATWRRSPDTAAGTHAPSTAR